MHSNITVMCGDTARYFIKATSIWSLYYSEWFQVTQNETVKSICSLRNINICTGRSPYQFCVGRHVVVDKNSAVQLRAYFIHTHTHIYIYICMYIYIYMYIVGEIFKTLKVGKFG
jgi:hypothetical protein